MIAKWFIVAWFALGALLAITTIGKPRTPMTPGEAAFSVLISTGLIVLVVVYWPTDV